MWSRSIKPEVISLARTLKIAKSAIEYAHEKIKKGSTTLENNQLSDEYTSALNQGVYDIRNFIYNYYKSHQQVLDQNFITALYENEIAFTSKYSLGNCSEESLQALDYVLCHVKEKIRAEAFFLLGGDHAFLVLNRSPDSWAFLPSTWGENAVICDPWAGKFYKASDYSSQLKTYVYKPHDTNHNNVEPLKWYRHFLLPQPFFNSSYLTQARNPSNLLAKFFEKVQKIQSIFRTYKRELELENKRLQIKYGDNDKKCKAISDITNNVYHIITEISKIAENTKFHCTSDNAMNYHDIRMECYTALHHISKITREFTFISNENIATLSEYRNTGKLRQATKFFGIRPAAITHLEEMVNTVNIKLSKLRN